MSISNKFFQKLEDKALTAKGRDKDLTWREIYYYLQRCLFNATMHDTSIEDAENFLDQAWRLEELLERMNEIEIG